MIYKLKNGGIAKLKNKGKVPEYGDVEKIAAYNREHGTNFYKMSQVIEHDKQQAQKKSQDKKKTIWNVLATGAPESAGEAILNKTIETANNAELPETREGIYKDTGKKQLATTAGALLTLPMLGEFSTYGLLGGASRIAGGMAGSAVGSYALGKAGELGDRTFGTTWMKPTGQVIGGFVGWVPGSSIAYKGALDLASAAPRIARIGATKQFVGDVAGRALGKSVKSFNISKNPFYSNPTVVSTIDHLYKEHPELAAIGPKEVYSQYYKTIFPASKVQIPYAHGTRGNLSKGLEGSTKISYTAAPETIGRNDFYLNLQPEASLQYADGIGVPEGFTWNKHRFWPLKEILGKPYKSDSWMSEPIQLRKQIPNRAGQFSRVKNTDGTYSGHGKLLEEYKAELGMQDLSDKEFLQKFGIKDGETFEQWVAENKQKFSDIYNSGNYHGLYHVKVDASNPLTINGGNTYYSERGIWDKMNTGKNDILLHNNAVNEFGSDVMVVKDVDPSKVRILGSDPDKQAFIDFMNGHNITFTPIPQKSVSTVHFDPRVKPMSRPILEFEKNGKYTLDELHQMGFKLPRKHLQGDDAVKMFKEYGTKYPETTRLYRVTGTSGNFTPSSDGTAEFAGQWFTNDPNKVWWYGENAFKEARRAKVENPIELQVVDIPTSQLEKFRAKNIIGDRKGIEFEPEDFIIPLETPRGRAPLNLTGNQLIDQKAGLPQIPTQDTPLMQQLRKYVPEARERYGLVGNTNITDDEIAGSLYKKALELGGDTAAVNEVREPLILFRGDTKRYLALKPRMSPEELATKRGTMDNSLGTLFLDFPKHYQGVDRYLGTIRNFNGDWEYLNSGTGSKVIGGSREFDPTSGFPKGTYKLYSGLYGKRQTPISVWKLPGSQMESGINDLNGFVVRTKSVRDATPEISVLNDDWLAKGAVGSKPHMKTILIEDENGVPLFKHPDGSITEALAGTDNRPGMAEHYRFVLDDAKSKEQGLLWSRSGAPLRDEHTDYNYYALPNFNIRGAKHILPFDLRMPMQWGSRIIYRKQGGILKAQDDVPEFVKLSV